LCPHRSQVTFRTHNNQKQQRLGLANAHIIDNWTHTIFSDEHTFYLSHFIAAQHDIQWTHSNDGLLPSESDRYSLNVCMWGGIWYNGKTKLVIYEGTLKAPAYIAISKEGLLPMKQEVQKDRHRPWRIMQHHAHRHTAVQTNQWLSNNDIPTMHSWPPKSADINSIENIWAFLVEQV
jgi:hypothetical protein